MPKPLLQKILLILLPVLLWLPEGVSNAQDIKLHTLAGTMVYRGDLNSPGFPAKPWPAFGLGVTFHMTKTLGFRPALYAGMVEDSDTWSSETWRKQRNLSFRSPIAELSASLVYDFAGLWPDAPVTPYFLVGTGVFYFEPQAYYQGEWVKLRPLSTEGQGTDAYIFRANYGPVAMVFYYGMGVQVALNSSRTWRLGLEAAYRHSNTDYLDDVSTTYVDPALLLAERGPLAVALSDRSGEVMNDPPVRQARAPRGNPERNDGYLVAGLTLTRTLDWDRPQRYRKPPVRFKKSGCDGKFF